MTRLTLDLDRALAARARAGGRGGVAPRRIALGDGWTVDDVICTSGPDDRPFEERWTRFGVAVVVAGGFRHRSAAGRELLTPGSLLLGNAGQCFECGHEHGAGDRCLAFNFTPAFFERLAADAGASAGGRAFRRSRLPPLRQLAPLVARAAVALAAPAANAPAAWEELAVALAERALALVEGLAGEGSPAPPNAEAQVARAARRIERHPDEELTLAAMAAAAALSPFHFLRTFERVTGVTPHQFVRRTRLRAAALRLAATREPIVEVAYDCGFGDLANFHRAFRAELGVTPRAFRLAGA